MFSIVLAVNIRNIRTYQKYREIFSFKVINYNLPWLHRIKRVMTIPSKTGTRNILLPKFMFAATSSLTWGDYWLGGKEVREKKKKKRAAGSSAMILTFEPDRRELPGKCAKRDPSSFWERNDGAAQRWGFGIRVYKEASFSEVKKKTFNLSHGHHKSADLHRILTCLYRNQVLLRDAHTL